MVFVILLSLLLILSGECLPLENSSDRIGRKCINQVEPYSPNYYTIDLVSTKKVPGAGLAEGKAKVTYLANPFGISLSADGSYQYRLDIKVDRLRQPKKGVYAVWVTTPNLDQIIPLGVLDDLHSISGTVEWNKFLVVITLEDSLTEQTKMWQGPIVLRGVSRSGLMHTMAGHGPFEDEPCALYGY